MIELIDPSILSLISSFFVVIIILVFAWKSGYFKNQFAYAETLQNVPAKDFFILMFKSSIPTVVSYMKWLFGYFIRIAWFLIIFTMVATAINDFETSFLVIFAIVSAKVSMMAGTKSKKGSEVIVLSQAEHERILKGDAKLSDFNANK